MALASVDVYNRRLRELTGQARPRRPQRQPNNENLPHVQTFSNILGVLTTVDGRLIDIDAYGDPIQPIATQADIDFYLPHTARPSTATRPLVEDCQREGGWSVDALGRQFYAGHGKLEEINSEKDDNDNKSAINAFHDINSNHHDSTPRRPLSALSPMTTGNGNTSFGLRHFASPSPSPLPPSTTPPPGPRFKSRAAFSSPLSSEFVPFGVAAAYPNRSNMSPSLPPNATPPPRPSFKKMRELSPMSTGDARYVVNGHVRGPTPLRTVTPAPKHTTVGPLDTQTEIELVQECLGLISLTAQDIQFMYTAFLVIDSGGDLVEHGEICKRLEESVISVRNTLTRRNQIGEEEWKVRSAAWHVKYGKRLLSLRRTLQRLMGIKKIVDARAHMLRPKQRILILLKLKEHDRKMADLASKFGASFDRLKLRHLHYLLKKAHKESKALQKKRQDQVRQAMSHRASFERRWNEGKKVRADLRREFYSFRSGRPPPTNSTS